MSLAFLPKTGYNKVAYTGPSVTPNSCQRMCFFEPDLGRYARPAAGWPCLVWFEMGGFRFTTIADAIGPQHNYLNTTYVDSNSTLAQYRLLYDALSRGWAVAYFSVTPAFSATIGNGTVAGQVVGVSGVPAADITYVIGKAATAYNFGTAPDGNGICMPWNGGTYPTGYKDAAGKTQAQGAIHPYQDMGRHNALFDGEMAAQFLGASKDALKIDMTKLYAGGNSAGADVAIHCAYGPNFATTRYLNPVGQELLPTNIYKGAFPAVWQPYMNMVSSAYHDPRGPCRTPKSGSHILDMHYDDPADDISNTDRDYLKAGDIMELYDTAALTKLSVTWFTDNDTYNSGGGAGKGPWVTPVASAVTTNPHDGYGLGLWKQLLGSRCVGYLLTGTGSAATAQQTSLGILTLNETTYGYNYFHNIVLGLLEADCGMTRQWAFDPRFRRRVLA